MSEELKRAGLLVRTVAKILDLILVIAAAEVIPKAGFYAGLLYLLIGDGLFSGKSVGKKLVGLRVVSSVSLEPCSIRESIIRNSMFGFGYLLTVIPWLGWVVLVIISAGEFILVLGSEEKKRLGDEIAETLVLDSSQERREV